MPEATTEAPEVEDVDMEDREEAEPEAQKHVEMDSALEEAKEGVVPTGSTLPAAEPVAAPPKGPEVVMFNVAISGSGLSSSSAPPTKAAPLAIIVVSSKELTLGSNCIE